MAKRQKSGGLNRLAGKRFVFNGKFDYGVKESLVAMSELQQAKVCDDLDNKVDYLVVADLNGSKTIQKKAMSLNGKGAAIQVIDADSCRKLAEPTEAEVLELLRSGQSEAYAKVCTQNYVFGRLQSTGRKFQAEDLRGAKLLNVDLSGIAFEDCNFSGAEISHAQFGDATRCDFSKVIATSCSFDNVTGGRFQKAALKECRFTGDFSDVDFTGASLNDAAFAARGFYGFQQRAKYAAVANMNCSRASVTSANFMNLDLASPNFAGSDLSGSTFHLCRIQSGNFSNAKLRNVVLVGAKLPDADLSGADLTGANFSDADLTGANVAGANFKNANVRGATFDRVDLSEAKNYDPKLATFGSVGPALTELDALNAKAKRLDVKFRLRSSEDEEGDLVGIDSTALRYGWGIRAPMGIAQYRGTKTRSFSDAMLQVAKLAGHLNVRFETVEVSSTKSPKGGKELRDLVVQAIAEAFAQDVPSDSELAEATKKFREVEREKGAAERERREIVKAAAAKEQEKAKKQIARKVKKAVGKVSDVASFLKALEVRIEKAKIDKSTKMLKASGFKLFNDVTERDVCGVVKSQTDPDLVYACRLDSAGQYSCCTQNLNVCGGLRGSICKHLLVLIIGLVQAGELDPSTIDAWIAKTHSTKPELDKEVMGAIFIKYKGAEAGEVDWRPTETVPEDYYAL